MEAKLYNGLALAYIGDSVYELYIRKYLLSLGLTKVNELHKHAIKYTSGESQAKVIRYFKSKGILNDEEMEYYKRGRNSSVSKVRKNIQRIDYLEGTGFESLIGYLYLSSKTDRMYELMEYSIKIIEVGDDCHEEK